MNGSKLTELYVSESRDNLAALGRALLGLESDEARAANDAAFRAAHNLKAMAAAIGDTASARLAHALEDGLAALRDGTAGTPDVDALLAAADELEASIARGLEAGEITFVDDGPTSETPTPDAPAPEQPAPPAASDKHAAVSSKPAFAPDPVSPITAPAPVSSKPAAVPSDVRLEAALLDAISDGVTELAVLQARFGGNGADRSAVDRMRTVVAALQESVLEARMVPLREAFDRFPRLVREAARAVGKQVELRIEGEAVRLDRAILDELVEPLTHLLRNAVDHGIEPVEERQAAGKRATGLLTLRAERLRNSLRIEVADDGGGIDRARATAAAVAMAGATGAPDPSLAEDADSGSNAEDAALLRILSQPGFSLAGRVTELSGRGVGLDVVVERVRTLGGILTMRTEQGRGTRFAMKLPLTLAVTQALRVRVGADDYVIPLTHVAEVIELGRTLVVASAGRESVRVRGQLVPLVRLRRLLGVPDAGGESAAVVAELGDRRAALAVDALVAREQIVVRPFDAPASAPQWFSGASLLADGRPVLILDPASVS